MDIRLASAADLDLAAQLLHDFNTEYNEPTPQPAVLAQRLREVPDTDVLLAGEVGVAVLRFRASLWSSDLECYLAELYVQPAHRGKGIGRALLQATLDHARSKGAGYLDLGTSEDDVAARHLYESLGMRRTEGNGGPLMFVYEIDLG
ncbi:MAG: GNAT family N-acetyltransferase [Candidatus Nanopelagicales bacterium]